MFQTFSKLSVTVSLFPSNNVTLIINQTTGNVVKTSKRYDIVCILGKVLNKDIPFCIKTLVFFARPYFIITKYSFTWNNISENF